MRAEKTVEVRSFLFSKAREVFDAFSVAKAEIDVDLVASIASQALAAAEGMRFVPTSKGPFSGYAANVLEEGIAATAESIARDPKRFSSKKGRGWLWEFRRDLLLLYAFPRFQTGDGDARPPSFARISFEHWVFLRTSLGTDKVIPLSGELIGDFPAPHWVSHRWLSEAPILELCATDSVLSLLVENCRLRVEDIFISEPWA